MLPHYLKAILLNINATNLGRYGKVKTNGQRLQIKILKRPGEFHVFTALKNLFVSMQMTKELYLFRIRNE